MLLLNVSMEFQINRKFPYTSYVAAVSSSRKNAYFKINILFFTWLFKSHPKLILVVQYGILNKRILLSVSYVYSFTSFLTPWLQHSFEIFMICIRLDTTIKRDGDVVRNHISLNTTLKSIKIITEYLCLIPISEMKSQFNLSLHELNEWSGISKIQLCSFVILSLMVDDTYRYSILQCSSM